MKIKANAKINLSLDIVCRREDGYHELDTVFYELSLCDHITVNKTDKQRITVGCSDHTLSCGDDNLAYKAAKLLLDEFGLKTGVDIYIEKNIPMGAGLGGGSSDAAAVLRAVNELFTLGLSDEELKIRAVKLGADVPFFITGGAARAKGIGEELDGLKGIVVPPMIVVKPSVSVSTVFAYKAFDAYKDKYHPDIDRLIKALQNKNDNEIFESVGNSFEGPVFEEYYEIAQLKQRLVDMGASACVMTGSGSALFALFDDVKKADVVYRALSADNNIRVFPEF